MDEWQSREKVVNEKREPSREFLMYLRELQTKIAELEARLAAGGL